MKEIEPKLEEESDDENKQITGKIVVVVFFGALLIYIGYVFFEDYKNRKETLFAFDKTYGWITKYWDRDDSDAGDGRTITYSYKVANRVYSRSVFTMVIIDECDQKITPDCAAMRFFVIFSKKDTAKSLIDLTRVMTQDSVIPFPSNIDDFE